MNTFTACFASATLLLSLATVTACGDSDEPAGGSSGGGGSSSSSSGETGSSSGTASSSSGSSSGGSSSGTASSSGGTSSGDAGPTAVNGCSTYADHTGVATYTIDWVNPLNDADKCIRVSQGTQIIWQPGDRQTMANHPLAPQGGDQPNPVPNVDGGDQATHVFDTAGTFGYVCTLHPNMTGAIQVAEE